MKNTRFTPLSLNSIKPEGWLARQLRIQADGLSGHLDEMWPDIRDSQWFGGDAEGWERAPYWLDGLIPLAALLDDATLKAKVEKYMDYIITHQHSDGWLGPRDMVEFAEAETRPKYDVWAQMLILKAFTQYYDMSGDERAWGTVAEALRCLDATIDTTPLFDWGQFRWFETLIGIYWLYESTGEQWLLDLAVKLQAQGFDWTTFFERWPLTERTPDGRWGFMSHVVNNAMAIKAPALWWQLSGDERDRAASAELIEKLHAYHGSVTGVFTGDECLAGLNPVQGTELCAVVEYAYSLELLLSIIGDAAYGDQLEKIVFNALPATFSPDMWAHQYDQQVNQVECSIHPRAWTTNGPESNLFGLEPNYGCCTANLSQGWPKFAAHLWMRSADESEKNEGLAVVAYAPSSVNVDLQGIPVQIRLETDYPFRDTLHFTVSVESPLNFPFYLRIPSWAAGATVQIAGEETITPQTGSFHCIDRDWQGTTEMLLTLPMQPVLGQGFNQAMTIERGPLVYALKIGEDWRQVHEDLPYRTPPHADWEIYPTTPWNYALDLDQATLTQDLTFNEHPIGDYPFSPDGAPVSATTKGKRIPQWGMENGSAADIPSEPVFSEESVEEITLIPFGCTNLRVTEFPVLRRS